MRSRLALFGVVVVLSGSSAASAASYDLVADFGAPVFQYGQGDSALYAAGTGGSSFLPFSTHLMCGLGAVLECQWNDPNPYPYIQKNPSSTEFADVANELYIPANGFNIQPGPGSLSGVVRFNPTSTGTYQIDGFFSRNTPSYFWDGADIAIYKVSGGVSSQLFLQYLPIGSVGSSVPFSLTSILQAGDSLDFLVAGHGTNFGDGTMISGTIVTAAAPAIPEPAAWGMMIAGFGLAGASIRRRQKATVRFA